ncbi:RP1-2 domain-containing protein [Caerostris darwini]|uniref:RP1-2 domain-containing protein n=1 Tax=Caerostris darwini TaxID=1538125 RepID=A0AAV4PVV6_9ARAC|nr:RP1-2 domain-containing protein [Caerostris darwini]
MLTYPFGYAVEISAFPEPSVKASPLIRPCVKNFVSAFTDCVESSEVLTNVFDISLTTPKDFQTFMYEYVAEKASLFGFQSPTKLADIASKEIPACFDKLIPTTMIRIFANAVARFLFEEGVLHDEDADALAFGYANVLEDDAKRIVQVDNPKSKLQALCDGFADFLNSLGQLTPDKKDRISICFAKEVKLARNKF